MGVISGKKFQVMNNEWNPGNSVVNPAESIVSKIGTQKHLPIIPQNFSPRKYLLVNLSCNQTQGIIIDMLK